MTMTTYDREARTILSAVAKHVDQCRIVIDGECHYSGSPLDAEALDVLRCADEVHVRFAGGVLFVVWGNSEGEAIADLSDTPVAVSIYDAYSDAHDRCGR